MLDAMDRLDEATGNRDITYEDRRYFLALYGDMTILKRKSIKEAEALIKEQEKLINDAEQQLRDIKAEKAGTVASAAPASKVMPWEQANPLV